MDLFDNTLKALERSLDLYYKRHQILASNAANSETPKYQARELDFAGELDKALGNAAEPLVKTNPLHMDLTTSEGPRILPDNTGAVGADGNNVDIDINMGKISANARKYTSNVELLNVKLQMLRMAARGTGGF